MEMKLIGGLIAYEILCGEIGRMAGARIGKREEISEIRRHIAVIRAARFRPPYTPNRNIEQYAAITSKIQCDCYKDTGFVWVLATYVGVAPGWYKSASLALSKSEHPRIRMFSFAFVASLVRTPSAAADFGGREICLYYFGLKNLRESAVKKYCIPRDGVRV